MGLKDCWSHLCTDAAPFRQNHRQPRKALSIHTEGVGCAGSCAPAEGSSPQGSHRIPARIAQWVLPSWDKGIESPGIVWQWPTKLWVQRGEPRTFSGKKPSLHVFSSRTISQVGRGFEGIVCRGQCQATLTEIRPHLLRSNSRAQLVKSNCKNSIIAHWGPRKKLATLQQLPVNTRLPKLKAKKVKQKLNSVQTYFEMYLPHFSSICLGEVHNICFSFVYSYQVHQLLIKAAGILLGCTVKWTYTVQAFLQHVFLEHALRARFHAGAEDGADATAGFSSAPACGCPATCLGAVSCRLAQAFFFFLPVVRFFRLK